MNNMNTKNLPVIMFMCMLLMACSTTKKVENKYADHSTKKEYLKKELQKSAIKQASKEAKQYKKEGFRTFIGGIPLDKQIEGAWLKSVETDTSGFAEYVVANARVIGGNVSAAKMQATHQAKVEVAGLISSNVASLIENSVANKELSLTEATAVNKALQASKELIVADLGRVIKEIEIYRDLNNSVEVLVCLSYNSRLAAENAVKNIKQNLEQGTEQLHEKLDKMIGFNQFESTPNTNMKIEK